jgi:hypothetical protein
MVNDKDLDEILDRVLTRYSDTEPLTGLEDRVLQRVYAAKPRAGAAWIWALSSSVAALAMIAFFFVTSGRTPKRAESMDYSGRDAAAMPLPMVPGRQWSFQARFVPVTRHATGRGQLPKLENFPARTPMTAEERALLRIVTQSPEQAAKLFSEWQHNATEPIKIEPIQIEPLETGDSNTNEPEVKGAGY